MFGTTAQEDQPHDYDVPGTRTSTYVKVNRSKNNSKKEIRGGPSLGTRVVSNSGLVIV